MTEILDGIRDCLRDSGLDEDKFHLNSRLQADLGMESIDLLDMLFRLENKFGISLRDGEVDRMCDSKDATVWHLVELVRGKLQGVVST